VALRPRPLAIVVGYGRVGGALARALRSAGWQVRVLAHRPSSARRAKQWGWRKPSAADWLSAKLCFLCVPDARVAQVAREVGTSLGPKGALVHLAGALSIRALPKNRPGASFHPLRAISAAQDSLSGAGVAIAARPASLATQLKRLARQLGLFPLSPAEGRRALYHAGAVLAAGGVAAVVGAAIEALVEAGVARGDAQRALLLLAESALEGVRRRGPAAGLTGPVVRGDTQTVARHLAALPKDLRDLYRLLSLRTLDAVPQLLPAQRRALTRVLRAGGARG